MVERIRRRWRLVGMGIAAVAVLAVSGALAAPPWGPAAASPGGGPVAAGSTGQVVQAGQAGQAGQGDEAALTRELAERLLAPPYPGPDGQAQAAGLLPGRLPADLPTALPQPPGARLVGSVARRAGGRAVGWEVVLDAPGAAGEALDFYQRELTQHGWTAPPSQPGGPRGGFQPVTPALNRLFCQGQQPGAPRLSVTAAPLAGGASDVRLRLDAGTPGPCAGGPGPGRPGPEADRLPPLYAPDGVALRPTGGGGGSDRWSSEAVAMTDRSAAALEAHFAGQLAAAGWRRLDGRADGALAWSLWAAPGPGDWQGLLYALALPGQDRRDLYVRVASGTAAGGGPYPAPAAPAPTRAPGAVPATPVR